MIKMLCVDQNHVNIVNIHITFVVVVDNYKLYNYVLYTSISCLILV